MIQQLINGVNSISSYLNNLLSSISDIYQGVELTDLFISIFPHDISLVCASVIYIILFISIVSLIKKLIMFIGG